MRSIFAANGANVPAITDAGGTGLLTDGLHNLKLEVADRAGNISADSLLDLEIDTEAPPVTIIAIDPATTDTGVAGYPATLTDRVTSDTGTGFVGRAEADAIVRLYADGDANGVIDTPAELSLTVAVPTDANDAFPGGQWNTAYSRDLNDPNLPGGLPFDGVRELLVTAEDLADQIGRILDARGFTPGETLLHIHNHALGKNVALPGAVRVLASRGYAMVLQPHDFAEDFRPANFRALGERLGSRDPDGWHRWLYPQAPHIHYAVLNDRDHTILGTGGVEAHRLHLLPNPVPEMTHLPAKQQVRAKLAERFEIGRAHV